VTRNRIFAAGIVAMLAALGLAAAARADVTISTHPTKHMSCVSGVCTATGAAAVLNVGELNAMLGSQAVTVVSTAAAPDIYVEAGISWANSNMLTFDAHRSLHVDRTVDATAGGCLWIFTNDGGSGGVLGFGKLGTVHFADIPASTLQINGIDYTVADDVASLASAIAAQPGGHFALTAGYDASGDGIYAQAPIATTFTGTFEGLGNAISHLTIQAALNGHLALFRDIAAGAVVENVSVTQMHIHATGQRAMAGGVAATNEGTIYNVHTGGKISATGVNANTGGLVAINAGTITGSSANNLPQNGEETGGGLVGTNTGTIRGSWASGSMVSNLPGGLVGLNSGTLTDTYAVTEIVGRNASPYPGGLVGTNQASGAIATSYAAGSVTAVSNFGGMAGTNAGGFSNDYWDIQDTGASSTFGCGAGSCNGATGLDRTQLQSGLPSGFDPSVWGQAPGINNGLPYLLANPPR
jgi:hypothetical protein